MEMFKVGMVIGSDVHWGCTVKTMEEAVGRAKDMASCCQTHGVHATPIVERVEGGFQVYTYNGETDEISHFWVHDETEDQSDLEWFVESLPNATYWACYSNMTEEEALANFTVYLTRCLSQMG